MPLTPPEFFRKLQASLPKLKKQILKDVIAVQAKNFVSDNFRKQAYVDKGAKKWQARKDTKNKSALLIGSGTLRNQVTKARVVGDNVVIESSLIYAEVHNEGGTIPKKERKGTINFKITKDGRSRFSKKRQANFQQDTTFKAHTINIPQRQFIGESESLNNRIKKNAVKLIDSHLNKL